jgi:hypothetical protein
MYVTYLKYSMNVKKTHLPLKIYKLAMKWNVTNEKKINCMVNIWKNQNSYLRVQIYI